MDLSLDELIEHFDALEVRAAAVPEECAALMAPLLAESVKETFGDLNALAPLAESTIESKALAGYDQPDAPLIATGELRDGIQHAAVGSFATAGSEDPKMAWHEHGFFNVRAQRMVEPRPACRIGMERAGPLALEIAKNVTRETLSK